MASQRFRRKNQDQIDKYREHGRELECCHIIAKSNGGANNQDNFIMAGANFNRMIGNRHDKVMMALVYEAEGLQKVKAAIRASPDSGYREQDAMELVRDGCEEFDRMERNQGGIDMYDGEGQYDGLDGSKIKDPDYCEWVISVCNKAHMEEQAGK